MPEIEFKNNQEDISSVYFIMNGQYNTQLRILGRQIGFAEPTRSLKPNKACARQDMCNNSPEAAKDLDALMAA